MQIPEIIAQSDDWLAIDKPAGMVIHRSRGANDRHTLVSVMRDHIGPDVFPVNRLDRMTSGIILMARNKEAAKELSNGFAERTVSKTYEAIVRGWPDLQLEQEHIIDRELGGKAAYSRIELVGKVLIDLPLGKYPQTRLSRLRIHPKTGIFHQIRRHLRGWGYPVINDRNHGDKELNSNFHERYKIKRMLLHSQALSFEFGGETIHVETGWSGRTKGLIQHLGLMPELDLDVPNTLE